MRVAIDKEVQVNMSSNSRMTRSMGPAEEVSLPLPARIRKNALTTVGERGNAQTQVDGRVSQQGTAGNSSPFARPGSRAGSSIGAASEVGTPSTPNNPFARPDSRAGSTQRSPSSSSISLLSPSNSVSHGDADTSVCWDLVNSDPETDVVPGCEPETAMCVQDVDDQCVLQFTLSHAVGCALHRHTSRVIHRLEGKEVITDHPVAYVSGLFRGSQLNWAALTKEAYAIYMSVKKLSFYLTDAEVLLKSDHLPLKKFLQKNTLNNKVNNWAMELEAFNIKFQHVSGKTNILADTLSRLVDIDPDARLDPENAGWEFGYYVFETLPKLSSEEIASVCEVLSGTNIILPDPDLQEPFTQVLTSPLTNDQLQSLQAQDEKCSF